MKHFRLLIRFLILLTALHASAQIPSGYVQTTATVPGLANGQYAAAWTNLSSSPQLALLGCVSTFQQTVNGNFDASGHFSVQLADTAQICPSPSTWTFTLTFACSKLPNTAFMVQVPVTGGGGTEDISSQIMAALPSNPCGGAGGSITPAANPLITYYCGAGTSSILCGVPASSTSASTGQTTFAGNIETVATTTSKSSVTYSGSGLNDLTLTGTNVCIGSNSFEVKITATGTPDTFEWFDQQIAIQNLPVTTSPVSIACGLTVTFGHTTGHATSDQWTFTATGAQPYSAFNTTGLDNNPSFTVNTDGSITGNGLLISGVDSPSARNVIVGFGNFHQNVSSFQDTALGWYALFQEKNGDENTAVGYSTMMSDLNGSDCTAVGWQALQNTQACLFNTAIGWDSMSAANVTGQDNTGLGYQTLARLTSGEFNEAGGDSSQFNVTTGNNNTSFGFSSLFNDVTGSSNVALGYYAGLNETGSNQFYVNNVQQANVANDRAFSLLWGTFAGSAGSTSGQQLTINGALNAPIIAPGSGGPNCLQISTAGSITQTGSPCGSGSGNTTSTSLTTSHLPKANGANSIIDSTVVDNGTTVSTVEPVALGNQNATAFSEGQLTLAGSTTVGGKIIFDGNGASPGSSTLQVDPTGLIFELGNWNFGTVPTTNHGFYCVVSGGICTITDTGYAFNSIPNVDLANSSITIAGTSVALGGSTSSFPSPGAIGGTTPAAGSFTTLTGTTFNSTTNCAAAGTAANPSVVSCSAAPSGSFSCATNASTGTCVVDTTAVTANSRIFVQPSAAEGSNLSVTCNTTADTGLTTPRLASKSAGTSFTINLGTFTTNPLCFNYWIVN